MKRGHRVVGGAKELLEKLGRNDPCPCGSGRRFQELLHEELAFSTALTGAKPSRGRRLPDSVAAPALPLGG